MQEEMLLQNKKKPSGFELSSNMHMYYVFSNLIYYFLSMTTCVFLVWQTCFFFLLYANNF